MPLHHMTSSSRPRVNSQCKLSGGHSDYPSKTIYIALNPTPLPHKSNEHKRSGMEVAESGAPDSRPVSTVLSTCQVAAFQEGKRRVEREPKARGIHDGTTPRTLTATPNTNQTEYLQAGRIHTGADLSQTAC